MLFLGHNQCVRDFKTTVDDSTIITATVCILKPIRKA